MKRMYKVVFYFSAANKIVTEFAEAWTKKLALEKISLRYGSDVHFPQVEFHKTF